MFRRLLLVLPLSIALGVAFGLSGLGRPGVTMDQFDPDRLPIAHAYGECGSNGAFSCSSGSSGNANSSLVVYHKKGENNVEAATGEDWDITARYATADTGSCPCEVEEFDASVHVDYNAGTGTWSSSNPVWSNPPFVQAPFLCNQVSCSAGSWYKLRVQLAQTVQVPCGIGTQTAYLYQVLYKTAIVDNGYNGCGAAAVVIPTTQTFQTADNGQFECDADGSCPAGASITINYN